MSDIEKEIQTYEGFRNALMKPKRDAFHEMIAMVKDAETGGIEPGHGLILSPILAQQTMIETLRAEISRLKAAAVTL